MTSTTIVPIPPPPIRPIGIGMPPPSRSRPPAARRSSTSALRPPGLHFMSGVERYLAAS